MKDMQCKTRVTLHAEMDDPSEGHGFGRGVEQLLSGIQEHGSLNRTTKEMGMAYSKAWRILRQTEAEFGVQLVEREGAHGSRLTAEGVYWLTHYQEMVRAAEEAAQAVMEKYFLRWGE